MSLPGAFYVVTVCVILGTPGRRHAGDGSTPVPGSGDGADPACHRSGRGHGDEETLGAADADGDGVLGRVRALVTRRVA